MECAWVHRVADVRILVVDDDAVVLDLVSEQLGANGFVPLTARNVEEALTAVAAEPPALLLSDVRMLPRDGYELLEDVRGAHPQVRVVLMSSFAPAGSQEAARRAGADGFLRKPFTARELVDAVHGALEGTERPPPSS